MVWGLGNSPWSTGIAAHLITATVTHTLSPTHCPSLITHLQDNPKEALRIFTEESVEVEGLPRNQVLQHLMENANDLLVLTYLVSGYGYGRGHITSSPLQEHVINRWKDDTPVFHNTLLRQYMTQTKYRLDQYRKANLGQGREERMKGGNYMYM